LEEVIRKFVPHQGTVHIGSVQNPLAPRYPPQPAGRRVQAERQGFLFVRLRRSPMNPDFSVEKLGVFRSINACWGGDPPHFAGNLGLRRNILRCAQFKGRKAWNNANGSRRPAHKEENYELKCNRSESRHHAEGRPFAPGTYSWVPDRIRHRSRHRSTLPPSGGLNPELF
jgi:hypothetical protein